MLPGKEVEVTVVIAPDDEVANVEERRGLVVLHISIDGVDEQHSFRTGRSVLGEVNRELVQEELRLVVVDVLDVDSQVQVALQRRRDPEIEGLHPQQVNFLPLSVADSSSVKLPWTLERHFQQRFITTNGK